MHSAAAGEKPKPATSSKPSTTVDLRISLLAAAGLAATPCFARHSSLSLPRLPRV